MWCALLLSLAAQEPVTFRSLLEELADPASLARWPSAEYRLRTASETIPRSSVALYRLPKDSSPGGGRLLFEAEGPGAVVAIRCSGSNPPAVRCFVDGGETAALDNSGPASLLRIDDHARAFMPFERASGDSRTLLVPVPFARSIKVVGDLEEGAESSITWREYAPGTNVQSLTAWKDQEFAALLEDATHQLARGREQGVPAFAFTLSEPNPDGFLEALDPVFVRGPRAVDEIEFVVEAPDVDAAVDLLWMELVFDGETTVAAPFGAFFASRPGVQPSRTRFTEVALGARGHAVARTSSSAVTGAPRKVATFTSRWLMPYRDRFGLRIVNQGPPQTHVSATVRTIPWTWDERTLRFHASWRRTNPSERERTLVELRGRALVVGDARFAAGPPGTTWKLTDERTVIRDDAPPWKQRIVGGCLSYTTDSRFSVALPWTPETDVLEPDRFQSSLFVASSRRASTHALARWSGLDAAPVEDHFERAIELDPPVELDALTVWYGGVGAGATDATTERSTRVRPYDLGVFARAGVVEAEALAVIGTAPSVAHRRNRQPEIASGRWSGDVELRVVVRATTGSIDLDVPVSMPGKREVIVYPSKAPEHGRVRFYVDGNAVERTFDGFASELTAPQPFSLGTFELRTSMRLTLELLRPDDPAAPFRSVIGLDAVELR